MKAIPKWLLLPPFVAALVVLGPFALQTAATPDWHWPDLWQMTGALLVVTLLGLVLLGAGGIVPRLRQRGQPALGIVTLRQSVRLSARTCVHAVEFDDRILLVAEHGRGLVLLETGRVDASAGTAPRQLPLPQLRSPAPADTAAHTGQGLDAFRALLPRTRRA